MHDDEGRWGTVSDAAQTFGVSVDTIRRRMKRGELDARREQTPQGFRWLIRLPDKEPMVPPENMPGAPQTAEIIDRGSMVVYGPDPRDTLIEALQHELELRNRDIVRLHEVVGQQSQTAAALTAQITKPRVEQAPSWIHSYLSALLAFAFPQVSVAISVVFVVWRLIQGITFSSIDTVLLVAVLILSIGTTINGLGMLRDRGDDGRTIWQRVATDAIPAPGDLKRVTRTVILDLVMMVVSVVVLFLFI